MSASYPHTIDNGAGEQITFLGREQGDDGERLRVENRVSPGAGPPIHTHLLQAESLTVVSGRIGYQIPGEAPVEAGPGETVVFAAGVPHRFWNASDEMLHCTGWIQPVGNIEFFLGALYDSTRRGGKGRPGLFDVAYLLSRYETEFELGGMPGPIRQIVLPAIRRVGGWLGRYRRFADAPEPMQGPAPAGSRR